MNDAVRYVQTLVKRLDINLSGKVIITELATNSYFYAALIPLFAGAKKTIFISKTENIEESEVLNSSLTNLVNNYAIQTEIKIKKDLSEKDLREANILCNAGHVRPIDKKKLMHVNPKNVVVPLMYDAWEVRESDIDLAYCRKNGISVVGTKEVCDEFNIFFNVSPLILKMCLELGRVYNQNIYIYSNDDFGKYAQSALRNLSPSNLYLSDDISLLESVLCDLDLLVLCHFEDERQLLGENGILNFVLKNPNIKVVHLFGGVDINFVEAGPDLKITPPYDGFAKKMSRTFAYLGHEPVIDLFGASYKAAISHLNKEACVFGQNIV